MTRTRTRALDVDSNTINVDPRVNDLIRTMVEAVRAANVLKNEATRDEKAAQEKLDQLMAKAGDGAPWDFTHQFDGETLEVEYSLGTKEVVNKVTLSEKVDAATFMDCASVTKAAVVKHCGKNIQNMVIETQDGNWKATVKKVKA